MRRAFPSPPSPPSPLPAPACSTSRNWLLFFAIVSNGDPGKEQSRIYSASCDHFFLMIISKVETPPGVGAETGIPWEHTVISQSSEHRALLAITWAIYYVLGARIFAEMTKKCKFIKQTDRKVRLAIKHLGQMLLTLIKA